MRAINNFRSSNKLGYRLFLQSLAIALILTIILTGLQVWMNYQGLLSTIQNTETQIEQVTVGGIATALWNFSNPEVIAQIQGLVHYPYITYAEVRDNDHLVTSAGIQKNSHILRKEYPLTHTSNGQASSIGTLIIEFDTNQVNQAILNQVGQILVFQALNVTLVMVIILVLINGQITRHLVSAANYFRTFGLSNLNVPLILDKRPANDEVDTLAETINAMRANLNSAYEDLAESERKYSTLLSNLPGMAFRSKNDWERTMLLVSAGCAELIGCDAQKLLSDPKFGYGRLIHADDQDIVWNGIQSGLASDRRYELSYRLQTCDGQMRWVLERGVGIYAENGQLQAIEGFVTDITGQKLAENEVIKLNAGLEERVQQRTAELSDLYNNAPCGYHSLDASGTYVLINNTELNWLGYQRDELIGRMKFQDLLTPASAQIFQTIFPEFIERGFVNEIEYELVRKNGSILPILLTSSSLIDQDGRFVMSRTTIIDNTVRKQADEAKRLAQEKVEAANQELENANKELEAFSYSVSHDLRSPLRAIDGFSKIIDSEYGQVFEGESRRLFDAIHQNIIKMDQLITDLLALSRVSRVELNICTVDMSEMARLIFNEQILPVKNKPVELVLRPLPIVEADPGLIRQVWNNLIANALKYTGPRAEQRIEIGGHLEDGMVVYYVRDNGVGFNPVYSNKLFGTFQRLHKDSDFEGNGVGLAIVKRVVNRLGGKVWAEGQVDQGATFYFSLPE